MRAALYARVSTQRQAQAQTVEQQIETSDGPRAAARLGRSSLIRSFVMTAIVAHPCGGRVWIVCVIAPLPAVLMWCSSRRRIDWRATMFIRSCCWRNCKHMAARYGFSTAR